MTTKRQIVAIPVLLLLIVAGSRADGIEDEFDIEPNLNIDSVPIKPLVAPGIAAALENPLVRRSPVSLSASSAPGLGRGASAENMQVNEYRDLSGWGPIGKIHPKVLIKDKQVAAFHNRPLDARYLRLINYGNLNQMPYKSNHRVNSPSEKIRGMTIGMF